MMPKKRSTAIYSSDFEGFAAEVAADIWNKLIETPSFRTLRLEDYAGLFEAVEDALQRYRRSHPSPRANAVP